MCLYRKILSQKVSARVSKKKLEADSFCMQVARHRELRNEYRTRPVADRFGWIEAVVPTKRPTGQDFKKETPALKGKDGKRAPQTVSREVDREALRSLRILNRKENEK